MNPPIMFRRRKVARNWNDGLVALLISVLVALALLALALAMQGCQRPVNELVAPNSSPATTLCTADLETRRAAYYAVRSVMYQQRGGAPMTGVCLLDDGVRATVYGAWQTTRIEATADNAGRWRVTTRTKPVEGVDCNDYSIWDAARHDLLISEIDHRLTALCAAVSR